MRTEALTALLEPEIVALGYELWGLVYLPQGKHALLRIFIERDAGVTIDDCEKVSRQVGAVLDVENVLSGAYTLEVSSPGLDRRLFKLAQYSRYIGKIIALQLRLPQENRRRFQGELTAVEGDTVRLKVEGKERVFAFQQIEQAQVVVSF